jgi:hypothetical protein
MNINNRNTIVMLVIYFIICIIASLYIPLAFNPPFVSKINYIEQFKEGFLFYVFIGPIHEMNNKGWYILLSIPFIIILAGNIYPIILMYKTKKLFPFSIISTTFFCIYLIIGLSLFENSFFDGDYYHKINQYYAIPDNVEYEYAKDEYYNRKYNTNTPEVNYIDDIIKENIDFELFGGYKGNYYYVTWIKNMDKGKVFLKFFMQKDEKPIRIIEWQGTTVLNVDKTYDDIEYFESPLFSLAISDALINGVLATVELWYKYENSDYEIKLLTKIYYVR